jgi:hypothetical protein
MNSRWKFRMAAFVIVAVAAMGAIVMWLWNWLIPDLFNGPVIHFWQALGLMLLSRILFRGFYGMKHRGMGMGYGPWKNKWEKMSPEEKNKMRELWKKRCGGWTPCSDDEQKSSSSETEK